MMMNWEESGKKAGLTGAIGVVSSYVLFGEGDVSFNIGGMNIPAPFVTGLSCALASLTSDVGHQYVLPHIPIEEKFKSLESGAINFGLGAAGMIAASELLIKDLPAGALPKVGLAGGAIVLGGEFAYNMWVNPNTQSSIL